MGLRWRGTRRVKNAGPPPTPPPRHRSRGRVDGIKRARSIFRVAGSGTGGQKGTVPYMWIRVEGTGMARAVGMVAFPLPREVYHSGGVGTVEGRRAAVRQRTGPGRGQQAELPNGGQTDGEGISVCTCAYVCVECRATRHSHNNNIGHVSIKRTYFTHTLIQFSQ